MAEATDIAALPGAGDFYGVNPSKIAAYLKRSDLALAIGIMAILVVLILPLPTWLLDVCLAFSLSFSILILMTAVFIRKPLEFSSFPTILLITTMMRLALNLASTRLILGHGNEGTAASGHVIQAFGKLIMQGNFVIGLIVFAILVIVNFVVITKGSGRIAEVAARFTLDAMPGKQMAIDADLSAGLIDEKEASMRRKDLEAESNFFGAMDGATKFVRGDAIAGLMIVAHQHRRRHHHRRGAKRHELRRRHADLHPAHRSATAWSRQMPALIVSTAAGLMVSKAGVEGSTDKALMNQLSFYPQALGMAVDGDGRRGGAARHADTSCSPASPSATGALAWLRLQAQERENRHRRTQKQEAKIPGAKPRPRKNRSRPRLRSIFCASNSAMACCR